MKLETERLWLYQISDDEMKLLIEKEPKDFMKWAYTWYFFLQAHEIYLAWAFFNFFYLQTQETGFLGEKHSNLWAFWCVF